MHKIYVVSVCLIFLFTVVGCVTDSVRHGQTAKTVSPFFRVVAERRNIDPVFFSSIEEAPDYPVFERILKELSAEVDVRIDSFRSETYSSYEGFNGHAENRGTITVRVDGAERQKEFQLRVDGKEQQEKALKRKLSRSLAFELVEDVKALFLYMTNYTSFAGAEKEEEELPGKDKVFEGKGAVFTVSSEQADIDTNTFIQKIVSALQTLEYRVVQMEYLERLVELNRYNLSGMTEDSGEIMEFFDVEYLASVEKDGGFFLVDVISVSSSELVASFTVSSALDNKRLQQSVSKELSGIE